MALTITLERLDENRARAHVEGEALAEFDPRTLGDTLPRRHAPAEDVRAAGTRLWHALGGEALRTLLPRRRALNPDSTISIRSDDPELAAIPWEMLHGDRPSDEYLVLDYLLVREVPDAPLPDDPDSTSPWRLLVMGSDPLVQETRDETGRLTGHATMRRLGVVKGLKELRDALSGMTPPAPWRWHRIAPTTSELTTFVAAEPTIFHYTGHGSVIEGVPYLILDDGSGGANPQPARTLGRYLRGVYFTLLNACRTADSAEPAANLALALVQDGVPVAIGMRDVIKDDKAVTLAHTFYQLLAQGLTPAQAL